MGRSAGGSWLGCGNPPVPLSLVRFWNSWILEERGRPWQPQDSVWQESCLSRTFSSLLLLPVLVWLLFFGSSLDGILSQGKFSRVFSGASRLGGLSTYCGSEGLSRAAKGFTVRKTASRSGRRALSESWSSGWRLIGRDSHGSRVSAASRSMQKICTPPGLVGAGAPGLMTFRSLPSGHCAAE